jgi:hypothetical protein
MKPPEEMDDKDTKQELKKCDGKDKKKEMSIKQELEKYPLENRKGHKTEYISIFFLVLFALTIVLKMNYSWAAELITTVVAVWAIVVGYIQFRDVRYENSIDHFYDRLKLTNQKRDNVDATRRFAGPWYNEEGQVVKKQYSGTKKEARAYHLTVYVCLELDDLECALIKYKTGYMSRELALRSIRTFEHRCTDVNFRKIVEALHNESEQEGSVKRGYRDETFAMVKHILERKKPDLANGNGKGKQAQSTGDTPLGGQAMQMLLTWVRPVLHLLLHVKLVR